MAHQSVLTALYITNRDGLIHYASGIVGDRGAAEDIVQEAYLKLDAVLKRQSVEEPRSYLYRIVRNLALDSRRRKRREQRHVEAAEFDAAAEADDRPSPEMSALDKEQYRLLVTAMGELPERTRIALEMHRFGGCRLKEIAAHLGISTTLAHDLVAAGIAHCRRRLRRPA